MPTAICAGRFLGPSHLCDNIAPHNCTNNSPSTKRQYPKQRRSKYHEKKNSQNTPRSEWPTRRYPWHRHCVIYSKYTFKLCSNEEMYPIFLIVETFMRNLGCVAQLVFKLEVKDLVKILIIGNELSYRKDWKACQTADMGIDRRTDE